MDNHMGDLIPGSACQNYYDCTTRCVTTCANSYGKKYSSVRCGCYNQWGYNTSAGINWETYCYYS